MIVAPVVDVLQGRIAVGEDVTVRGWVRTRRDSKLVSHSLPSMTVPAFNQYRPSLIIIYRIIKMKCCTNHRLFCGSHRKIVESRARGQNFEIQATSVVVVGMVDDPETYPMAAKRHSIEYLREVAHLRPRTNLIGAVARVRHTLAQALPSFLR